MKKNQKTLCISLSGIFAVLFVNCFLLSQEIEIKMEDGIPVVYNPKEPVPLPDTPSRLTLIEDLRLGEPDENQIYPFSRLNWLSVDSDENIIIMDNEEGCIRIFDKTGKLLKRFGRKGQDQVFFRCFRFRRQIYRQIYSPCRRDAVHNQKRQNVQHFKRQE